MVTNDWFDDFLQIVLTESNFCKHFCQKNFLVTIEYCDGLETCETLYTELNNLPYFPDDKENIDVAILRKLLKLQKIILTRKPTVESLQVVSVFDQVARTKTFTVKIHTAISISFVLIDAIA